MLSMIYESGRGSHILCVQRCGAAVAGLLGQQHITQVQADACTSNPLDRFTIGDSIEVRM